MPKQDLNGSQAACLPINEGYFSPAERMRSIARRFDADLLQPTLQQSGVLARRKTMFVGTAAREEHLGKLGTLEPDPGQHAFSCPLRDLDACRALFGKPPLRLESGHQQIHLEVCIGLRPVVPHDDLLGQSAVRIVDLRGEREEFGVGLIVIIEDVAAVIVAHVAGVETALSVIIEPRRGPWLAVVPVEIDKGVRAVVVD